MTIYDFETAHVRIYKEALALIDKKNELEKIYNLIKNNYDSKVTLLAQARSSHNENSGCPCEIDIPLDVIFGKDIPTQDSIVEKISLRIYDIDMELADLKVTLTKLVFRKGDVTY